MIGIVWDTDKPEVDYIYDLVDLITVNDKLSLPQLFDGVAEKTYTLRGIHFVCCIFRWLNIDISFATLVTTFPHLSLLFLLI